MNWVGGSRSRLVMRNDAKKQREFFEKKRIEQKLKKLGVKLPNPSGSSSSGSTDLMTLLIVNQIASKKANPDPPKVTVFGSSKKSLKHRRYEAIALPMSPGSPSELCLTDSQPQYSFQGIQTRKAATHQGFKCGQLSPVLESAFSDNSASDYLPPRTDLACPSSSSSSVSSGRGRASSGIFHFQMNPQKESYSQAQIQPQHLPWENVQQSGQFQPFSQPRSMTEVSCWSKTSDAPLFHIQTPTQVQGLIGHPEPDKDEGEVRRTDVDVFPTKPPEEGLDFTLSQGESKHVTHEDVFNRFCQDEEGREGYHGGEIKSKIFLTEEPSVRPSVLQTVFDSQSVVSEFYKNADLNSSPPGQTPHPAGCCEYSPCCSCRRGYYSSNSDDEHCSQQDSSSFMAQACCSNHLDQALLSPELPQSERLAPPASLSDETKVLESLETAPKGQMIEIKSPPVGLSLEDGPPVKPCGCKKVQTRDAAAQTVSVCALQSRDAATQCGPDGEPAASGVSGHQLDVRGVSGRGSKSQVDLLEEKKTPWQEILQRPANPFEDSPNTRGSSQHLPGDERVNPPPQEDTQLEEIADILLLLKQKK